MYVIICDPVPAVAGENDPAVTPVPVYVPPAGEPPVKAKSAASTHTSAKAVRVTVGSALTVMV